MLRHMSLSLGAVPGSASARAVHRGPGTLDQCDAPVVPATGASPSFGGGSRPELNAYRQKSQRRLSTGPRTHGGGPAARFGLDYLRRPSCPTHVLEATTAGGLCVASRRARRRHPPYGGRPVGGAEGCADRGRAALQIYGGMSAPPPVSTFIVPPSSRSWSTPSRSAKAVPRASAGRAPPRSRRGRVAGSGAGRLRPLGRANRSGGRGADHLLPAAGRHDAAVAPRRNRRGGASGSGWDGARAGRLHRRRLVPAGGHPASTATQDPRSAAVRAQPLSARRRRPADRHTRCLPLWSRTVEHDNDLTAHGVLVLGVTPASLA